ncbi:isochorismatase family protein [Methylophilus sp. 14]|uniref:isochorismatase family protein n=1 Tax=Methylophilus sp. 14 TaxID=2781019 RepID=UPI00188FAA3A|nr:isochorismatase family protein [Methylophilus sp. 14]MBF4987678.1 isochorismatase family protein [Methylophilus sp. 14]
MKSAIASTEAVWILIDVQTRLCDAMPEATMATVVKNIQRLLQGAQLLNIPLWVTEQYPEKLGETLPALQALLPEYTPRTAKLAFSAWHEPALQESSISVAPQVVLFGLETHICVLQTALDALAAGKQVFIVEDAVISRSEANRKNAIERLRAAGCIITNTESMLFEPMQGARHAQFKAVSALIR